MLKWLLRKFTDNYNKMPDGVIGKLMYILAVKLGEIKETAEKVELWKDLQEAQGTTLDLIGEDVGQSRNGRSDVAYRILIQARRAANESCGDLNGIIRALATMLRCEYEEIYISEVEADDTKYPAHIAMVEVPADVLETAELRIEEVRDMLKQIISGGVSIGTLSFTGSFAFSDYPTESQMDRDMGFSDVGQTFGGRLGYVRTNI